MAKKKGKTEQAAEMTEEQRIAALPKIEELTPEQERILLEYRDHWLAVGRSCEPAVRPVAERVWGQMYAGLDKPVPLVLWFDGPASAAIYRTLLAVPALQEQLEMRFIQVLDQLLTGNTDLMEAVTAASASVNGNTADSARFQLSSIFDAALDDHLCRLNKDAEELLTTGKTKDDKEAPNLVVDKKTTKKAKAATTSSISVDDAAAALPGGMTEAIMIRLFQEYCRALVVDFDKRKPPAPPIVSEPVTLIGHIVKTVACTLPQTFYTKLVENIGEHLGFGFWGSHEVAWAAYYNFPHVHLRPIHTEEQMRLLNMWLDLCSSTGWWHPFENVIIACERPAKQAVNEEGLLHCEDGPALICRDEWRLWRINGIEVDEQIVMRPETQTVEQINRESNQDVRSIRISRFGWTRYINESGAVCVDERHNDMSNTKEALFKTVNNDCRLVVTCPTGRMFSLGVPDSITTCEAAQTWLNGEEKMNIIART